MTSVNGRHNEKKKSEIVSFVALMLWTNTFYILFRQLASTFKYFNVLIIQYLIPNIRPNRSIFRHWLHFPSIFIFIFCLQMRMTLFFSFKSFFPPFSLFSFFTSLSLTLSEFSYILSHLSSLPLSSQAVLIFTACWVIIFVKRYSLWFFLEHKALNLAKEIERIYL